MPGISVAATLRRKTKITITTIAMLNTSVNSTSPTEARVGWVRSIIAATRTLAGIAARRRGIAALMRPTVSITLAPGWLVIANTMARPLASVSLDGAAAPA